MATKVFKNISLIAGLGQPKTPLRGAELAVLTTIENGYLIIEGDEISTFGKMEELKYEGTSVVQGTVVLPAWCDSHTHLVYAESREAEFVQKIQGASYAEIAAAGGGILNSARKIASYPEDKLFNLAWKRIEAIAKNGTGAVEIKSGYGLSVEGELKMLRVIKRLKEKSPLIIKATFLGAHAYPQEFRTDHEGYLNLIISEMLPVIASEGLADYVDAFCETGFFSPEEMLRVCEAARQYGFRPKLHVNQLNSIGGIQAGIQAGAVSLDHLETLTEEEISLLGNYDGISTLLPGAAFFLRMNMPPARKLIAAHAAVALATDFNPGSCPTGNMHTILSLACIQMRMLPAEAINAATINGAFAMELNDRVGTIAPGKKANLIFTKPVPSLAYLPYSFGEDVVDKVMINGNFI